MIYQSLSEIPYSFDKALIINVGTPEYTTQVLLSLRRESDIPCVIVDCPYKGNNDFQYLSQLQSEYHFDLVSMPLQKHGITLDAVFSIISCEWLLLIDSDIEFIENTRFVESTRSVAGYLRGGVFGIGTVSSHTKLTHESMPRQNFGLYQERMMIPVTMLNVAVIRETIQKGFSFLANMEYNDIPQCPKLSRWLSKRFAYRRTFNLRLAFLDVFRKAYFGKKPCVVMNDTGAAIWMHLKYECGMQWIESKYALSDYARHYHGKTRSLLCSNDPNVGQGADGVYNSMQEKLLKKYNFDITNYR